MIEFLQDYTTSAIPPERFEQGQQVEREQASEDYLVRIGVAAYVVDGKLVDQDHRPVELVTSVAEIVSPGDRRAVSGARGGELLSLDAPQRASTGPVAGTPEVVLRAQVEQLRTERDEAVDALGSQQDDHGQELAVVRAELDKARSDLVAAAEARDTLQAQLDTATARVAELEAATVDGDGGKTGKAK